MDSRLRRPAAAFQQRGRGARGGAGVAAVAALSAVTETRSDYQNFAELESKPLATILHRKSMYGGQLREIRGRAPQEHAVVKVKGHVDADTCTTAEDKFNAEGNAAADRLARAASDNLPRPSEAELHEWNRQVSFLRRYLQFIPEALEKWPAIRPSLGRKTLPRRAMEVEVSCHTSFLDDALGPLRRQRASASRPPDQHARRQVEPPKPPEQDEIGTRVDDGARPEESGGRAASRGRHDWVHTEGRWICRACLSTSRQLAPPNSPCPGLARHMRDALMSPKGHKLHVATFSSGVGMVIVCSKCGQYTASRRPCFQEECKGRFESAGARAHFERVSSGLHPRHAKGRAKVLDPVMSAATLLGLGLSPTAEG